VDNTPPEEYILCYSSQFTSPDVQFLHTKSVVAHSRRTAEEADIIFTASFFLEEQQIQDTTRNCNKT
jgi:hypothetical protein